MPGFFVSNGSPVALRNEFDDRCIAESIESDGFFCARNTLNKFLEDKALAENERYVVIQEGVLLNKRELFEAWKTSNVVDLVIKMYESLGDTYFRNFRGPFSGALFDRQKEKWVIFTSHCGDNTVFFYKNDDGHLIAGSQVNYILDALKASSIPISINESAIYSMLSYGFMVDASTYANEIKRLLPGNYLTFERGNVSTCSYYRPKQNVMDLTGWSPESIIDELDARFETAIRREFDKDTEYGLRHLCDLSGGLDSRMTTWVANKLGYKNCLNLTYSQSGYTDQVVAEQIAADLGNEFLFKALDDASFIFNAERITRQNFGLSLYSGITGGETFLRTLDLQEFGVEHTGQIGDVVVGTFLYRMDDLDRIDRSGAYSEKLLDRMPNPQADAYIDREQYLFETRAFLGALSTHMIRRNFTEVTSPFLDVDFLDFCLSIPPDVRLNHKLYKQWILSKHPDAATYVWEKEGLPVSASRLRVTIHRAINYVVSGFRYVFKIENRSKSASMNPMNYWYDSNEAFRTYLDESVRAATLSCSDSLQLDFAKFVNNATPFEKTQAITVMEALKFYRNNAD